jgi:uncharacterized RDD family membrane protein YckC
MGDVSTIEKQVHSHAYATFTARARALVTDAVIISVAVVALLFLWTLMESVPGSGGMLVVVLFVLVILYEPIMVALFGATIGHRRSNLRVVSDRTGGPPGFFAALVRFLLKAILGFGSFATMLLTQRHQAFHDFITRTTVQVRDVNAARDYDYVAEREPESSGPMPAAWRRILMSILYVLAANILAGIAIRMVVSLGCSVNGACSAAERAFSTTIGSVFLLGVPALLVLGWQGRLPGARRGPVAPKLTTVGENP